MLRSAYEVQREKYLVTDFTGETEDHSKVSKFTQLLSEREENYGQVFGLSNSYFI